MDPQGFHHVVPVVWILGIQASRPLTHARNDLGRIAFAQLDLGQHAGTTALADPVELHQRRLADREAVVAVDRGHRSVGEHRQCPHPNEGAGCRAKPT